MAEKYREVIVIDDSYPSSPELMGTSLKPVPSLKNRDEIKKFEETEDCFVLEFDPDDELNFSKLSISYNAEDDDLSLVAEKGKVACRDYPHSRHACGKFPFEKTPHDSHCELCYCYVCDLPAPCKKWVGISSHCDAFDNERWGTLRKIYRDTTELQKKSIFRAFANASQQEESNQQHEEKQGSPQSDEPVFEEVKLFVGNLPNDVNNRELRSLFWKAGVVKLSNVVYGKYPRTFGFVTMRSVQEAENAVEMFNGYELRGGLLKVNKAYERRVFQPTYKIYIGNLSGNVDNASLEQIFIKKGYKPVSVKGPMIGGFVPHTENRTMTGGFGFVEMSSECERTDAIATLNGEILDGRPVRVNIAY